MRAFYLYNKNHKVLSQNTYIKIQKHCYMKLLIVNFLVTVFDKGEIWKFHTV